MKSLRLAIEHTEATINPMHAFVCESPAVDREILLEGARDGDVRTLLFFVEGDHEAYERVLEGREGVVEYDVRPADSWSPCRPPPVPWKDGADAGGPTGGTDPVKRTLFADSGARNV